MICPHCSKHIPRILSPAQRAKAKERTKRWRLTQPAKTKTQG